MLRRLAALFDRYAAAHLTVTGAGFSLTDGAGRKIGAVDHVRLGGSRVHLRGWALAERVTLMAGRAEVSVRPGQSRADVAAELDAAGGLAGAAVGFELQMPRPEMSRVQPLMLLVSPQSGGPAATPAPLPLIFVVPLPRAGLARMRLAAGFGWRLIRLAPDAARWGLRRDPQARARIKRGLGLDPVPLAGALDRRLLLDRPHAPRLPDPAPVTIVLPVYNAFELLDACIARVVTHTDLPWHLIVVEDGSTDARVRPWLRDRLARPDLAGQTTLIENAENLGFIGAVNAGLARALDRGHHVVLLNTDAFVPAGWARRLLAPILEQVQVATVTPMSNDAEIFTAPVLCTRHVLHPGMADAIDAVARGLDPLAARADAPTGVGFCMAMNIAWLRRLPSLDPAFGRGYGEEVDWCQRARALGGRHVAIGTLFVEHRGGTSFGSEAKRKLVADNNAIISRRYPAYDGQVQAWMGSDPLRTPRLALALAWAAAWADRQAETEPDIAIPVYLAHSLGGGAESWLQARIRADLAQTGRPAVVLRVGGPVRWQIEVTGPEGQTAGTTEDFDLVCALLAPLTRRHIVYSCGVGDFDPLTLPGALLHLAGRPAPEADLLPQGRDVAPGAATGLPALPPATLEVLFHDFYPVSPGYTLLDTAGVYHGPLAPGSAAHAQAATDRAHSARRPDGRGVGLMAWQAAWGAALAQADRITVFSRDSRAQVAAAYPDTAGQIAVQPHALPVTPPRIVPAPGAGCVIGVLGNIGFQKGVTVVGALAARIAGQGNIALAVIGTVDPAYPLPVSVRIHGSYRIEDLPGLVARYGITHWLIPSIWPETFSYTTHEALATGMPVIAFDIGAQGTAVAAAANGIAVPFAPGPAGADAILAALDVAATQAAQ